MPEPVNRLIVVGASSGGIEALQTLIGTLPQDYAAPICIVQHASADSPRVLDRILARAVELPVAMARSGDRLQPRRVYVAPPDQHLLIEPGRVRLSRGPKENRFRPAIDPLFRSAAQVYGPRVIGVVLTGSLDDGAAGLWAIRHLGGSAVVEDPATAQFPSMPTHARRRVPDALVAPVPQLGALLQRLLTTSVHESAPPAPEHLEIEVRIANNEPPLRAGVLGLGTPSSYTCPECHGGLLAVREGGRDRYRCHTGHAYSIESLVAHLSDTIDDALGSAERALQEGGLLARRLAADLDPDFDRDRIAQLSAQADHADAQAQVLRQLLAERAAFAGEPTVEREGTP